MPKTIYIQDSHEHSGIKITWTPYQSRLKLGGWYDYYCGIESRTMTLAEFFDMLGITEKDIRRALKAHSEPKQEQQ
jgi:predicted transcriptional regulator